MRCTVAAAAAFVVLAGCGGSSPLDNPDTLANGQLSGAQKLAFAYFQRCVFPIFNAQLPIRINGQTSINTCAASGCHDNASGTGGAFRVIPNAQPVDVTNPANTADIIRGSDMYKNFYSAQGEVVFGSPLASRLLAKPMVNNVLHGGGVIFDSAADPNARTIEYWINHPVASGQSEFSTTTGMFTPDNPNTGACNTQ
ncbi:MAG: hypothetical protein U1E89_06375 [Burkholderiaceae bacterium]